jgi:type IV pilus assembly protein PilC
MPKFLYVGVSSGGKQVKGEIDAQSRNEVISLLRKKKIRTISVKNKPMQLNIPFLKGGGVSLENLSRFTRQFAAMTSAGLPLVQCLDILSAQTESKPLAKALAQVSSDIQGGSSLAEALRKHPQIFVDLYCNMVAAGEASGNLDVILVRLAEYQEKSYALRRKIKGAMTYPAVLLCITMGVIVVMLTFVIPTFAQMFSDMGGTLPLPTRIVMGISDFFRNNIVYIALCVIAVIIGYTSYYRTENGHYNVDKLKLRLPVLGNLERKSAVSRFSQTLSTLLSSGVTIIEALTVTAKTAGNKVLEKGLMRVLEKITGGLTIAEPLKDTGVFPPMVIHMVAVGEKTGDLSGMLVKISQFYEEEVDAAVDALTSIIEPIMIVVMGVIIAGLLFAMYLPMFDMVGNIK